MEITAYICSFQSLNETEFFLKEREQIVIFVSILFILATSGFPPGCI